jgi:hypothetical protein
MGYLLQGRIGVLKKAAGIVGLPMLVSDLQQFTLSYS